MRKLFFLALLAALPAHAEQPKDFQDLFAAEARKANAAFSGFVASRGEQFFKSNHGGDWNCSTCHTANPAKAGQHKVTGKAIEPLAPSANPERFTRAEKVEKWFRRNCKDVLKRECRPQEKGDVLAYLMALGH